MEILIKSRRFDFAFANACDSDDCPWYCECGCDSSLESCNCDNWCSDCDAYCSDYCSSDEYCPSLECDDE